MKINILGTEYVVKLEVPYNVESLEGLDGWTDETSKTIVVSDCKKQIMINLKITKTKYSYMS